jgi:hypothetical protein
VLPIGIVDVLHVVVECRLEINQRLRDTATAANEAREMRTREAEAKTKKRSGEID